ncbi:MAG: hypothetical protein F6K39_14845 [Okeania sp. SIO3B3]|nr:hypothetical protein [Okeania sp. SIO3B3]
MSEYVTHSEVDKKIDSVSSLIENMKQYQREICSACQSGNEKELGHLGTNQKELINRVTKLEDLSLQVNLFDERLSNVLKNISDLSGELKDILDLIKKDQAQTDRRMDLIEQGITVLQEFKTNYEKEIENRKSEKTMGINIWTLVIAGSGVLASVLIAILT